MARFNTVVPVIGNPIYGHRLRPSDSVFDEIGKKCDCGGRMDDIMMNVTNGRRNSMSFNTNSEEYGRFTGQMGKTYLPRLPPVVKNQEQDIVRRKVTTTSSEYGHFYGPTDHYVTHVNTRNPNPLPPIGGASNQGGYTSRSYPDDEMELIDSNRAQETPRARQSINLSEIADIDLNLLNKDLSSINIRPHVGGGVVYNTFPERTAEVNVPDIKEMTIRLRQKDGSVVSFHAVPKYRYHYQ